jgi:enoyl-CoA hydratase/carnithine racemase
LTESLLVEWGEHEVLTLTINRPERRNAVDPEVLGALAEALTRDGERAGAVILRGAGDEAFSAGYDLSRLTGTESDLDADRYIGEAVKAMRECPAPVIARLTGHCHGAGVELALTCDLRVGTPSVRMSVPAVGLGVVYRYEFVSRLVVMVGLSRATSLLLGMRELDAETAGAWGIFTDLCEAPELDMRVSGIASKLAGSPRTAVRGTKASLNLLVARQVNADDFTKAQRLRAAAAASPERKDALERRRQKK